MRDSLAWCGIFREQIRANSVDYVNSITTKSNRYGISGSWKTVVSTLDETQTDCVTDQFGDGMHAELEQEAAAV
jgi:hypothetical protein